MDRNIVNFLLSSLIFIFIFDNSVYPKDFSPKSIEDYTIKISKKFSNTYCNSTKLGISKDGALKFSIGETNKEFSNNKFNKFINYDLLKKNILINLENNCQIFDFPEYELENLAFKY